MRMADASPLFNAGEYLLDRQVDAGLGERTAVLCGDQQVSYRGAADAGAADRCRVAGRRSAVRTAAADGGGRSAEFVVLFLAALRIGAVPVPVSTMLTAADVAELLDRLAAPRWSPSPARTPPRSAPRWRPPRSSRGRHRPGRRRYRPATGAARHQRYRAERARRGPATRSTRRSPTHRRSGCTRRAPPAAPRPRCTGTARSRWCARPTPSRFSVSPPRTAACRRRRPSSPTASATPYCSRWRSGPARCCCRRPPSRTSSPSSWPGTVPRCSSAVPRSSPTCCAPSCPPTRWRRSG